MCSISNRILRGLTLHRPRSQFAAEILDLFEPEIESFRSSHRMWKFEVTSNDNAIF